MSLNYINAAPQSNNLGTQDLSTTQLPIVPEAVPSHLPKFFTFAKKGPLTPQLLNGQAMINAYGQETFQYGTPYTTHVTPFINGVNDAGNMMMIQRLLPTDVGPNSTIQLYLDVLATVVNIYQRNSDGGIATDTNGIPIVVGTAPGYQCAWVLENNTSDNYTPGALTQKVGSLTTSGGATSTMYPIFELQVSSPGEWGNSVGIRLWAPSTTTDPNMPTRFLTDERVFPYYLQVISLPSNQTTPVVESTLSTSQTVISCLKPNTTDDLTGLKIYIGDNFISQYQNLSDPTYPLVYGDFSTLSVYQNNIDTVLGLFQTAELANPTNFNEFTSAITDKYLFNFVNGQTSAGVPYNTFQIVDETNSVRLTQYANIYAAGGSDGTLSLDMLDTVVTTAMADYSNINSPIQDTAINVESIMYDSGFGQTAKDALANFISLRKDTFVVLSTFTASASATPMTETEEEGIATGLKTQLQMYPESDYFGTPVMRGMVVGRYGNLRNSLYTAPVPATYSVAVKSAAYMGASNGIWNSVYNFDMAPNSIIQDLYNINITYIPPLVRNTDWSLGLNFVLPFDRASLFFPALKTVYPDDTSVLNSYFTAMIICEINKVTAAAWRNFSGQSHLTNDQLAERVNTYISDNLKGRFDNRVVIIPNAQFTDMDILRGYSWTVPVQLYADNMTTVMTTYVQAYRMSSLPTTG